MPTYLAHPCSPPRTWLQGCCRPGASWRKLGSGEEAKGHSTRHVKKVTKRSRTLGPHRLSKILGSWETPIQLRASGPRAVIPGASYQRSFTTNNDGDANAEASSDAITAEGSGSYSSARGTICLPQTGDPPPLLLINTSTERDAEPSPQGALFHTSNSSLRMLTFVLPGLPQTPPSPSRSLARPGRRPRPAAQGRVHQGRHHAAQEAQLGRAEDGACAPDHRQDHHGLHPWRGPQYPAAQRGPGQGRQGAGLSRCAVQAGQGRAGSGGCDEQDERTEQVRHQEAQEGESELGLLGERWTGELGVTGEWGRVVSLQNSKQHETRFECSYFSREDG